MPGITGMGTTFNLPNFTGELFAASKEDTPLLSAIGGLTGGRAVRSREFTWQTYDLRDAADDRQRTEGANAPTAEARTRTNYSNVLEIHQEAIDISYTKMAATDELTTNGASVVDINGNIVPQDEFTWQINQAIKQVARDVEASFITGTYNNPTSNTAARRTRGLLEAITTNTTSHTAKTWKQITEDDVLDLMQKAWDNGGIRESETRTIVVNSDLKRALTKLFIKDAGYKEESRTVGGVNLQVIETDFGRCNIMLDHFVPQNTMMVLSLEQIRPVFMTIPGKGHFFVEPLAKVGASDRAQLYGEIGLEYGLESAHAVMTIKDATTSAASDTDTGENGKK